MGLFHSPKIVTDGLVLCLDAANVKSYPGSGTTWYDLSGNGYNGEFTNGAYVENGSVILDGVNDYIDFGQLLVLANSGEPNSIEFWFQTNKSTTDTTASGIQNFTGHSSITDDLHFLSIRNKVIAIWNKTSGEVGSGWYSGNTEILTTKTYHMVITFDGTGLYKLYVDSVLDSNWGNFGTADTRCAFSRIGNLGSDRDFSGKIHSFKVYTRALSQLEVSQNFNALRGRYGI